MLKLVYLAALVCVFFPRALFGGAGWIGIATGGGIGAFGLALIPCLLLTGWRFVHVIRNPQALASPPDHPVAALIRGAGVLLMSVSIVASVSHFFIGPITHLLFRGNAGDAGVGYFVVGLALYMISGVGLLGLLLFELGRWIARRADNLELSTRRGILMGALAAVVAVVLLGKFARMQAYAGYDELLARCAEPAAPIVKRQLPALPTSVLVQTRGVDVGYVPWSSDSLLNEGGLAFVEECMGKYCNKLTPGQRRDALDRQSLQSPTSPIELRLASASVEERRWGARLMKLSYTVEARDTGEVLAEASEWVYDWGRWKREALFGGQVQKDACGYAQADVHNFRIAGNGTSLKDRYAAADLRLLLSIVPEASRPPMPAETVPQPEETSAPALADAAPEPIPVEKVVVESSGAPTRTLPTLPGGGNRTELSASNIREAVYVEEPRYSAAAPIENYRGTVRLQPLLGKGVGDDGLMLRYCCAGAFSDARATRPSPAGRSYVEAMFIAENGRQAPGTFTRLGLTADGNSIDAIMMTGTRTVLPAAMKSGSVVGMLIDTDARRVEYFVNGSKTGTSTFPDAGAEPMFLWAAVASEHDRSGSSDRWILNFGATPFAYPPAEALLTYEGKVHRP